MTRIVYEIVEHDGGWAYKVDGVFSEPYPSHAAALAAAQRAAAEQTVPGHTETIEYEDEKVEFTVRVGKVAHVSPAAPVVMQSAPMPTVAPAPAPAAATAAPEIR